MSPERDASAPNTPESPPFRLGALSPLLLVVVAAGLLLPYFGYLTDDSYIHFQFAKNLIRGQGFAFNAGEPSYGATSPLWVLLLAAIGRFVPNAGATPLSVELVPPIVWIAKAVGAAATLLAVLAMVRWGRRLGWSGPERLALGGLLAFHAWSARWGLSGMETPLALLLVVLALDALAATLVEGNRSHAWKAGAYLALASVARPEALLLTVLTGVVLALGGREKGAPGTPDSRPFALGFVIPYGAWLVAAFALFHRLLPNTSAAKAGAWLDVERGMSAIQDSIRASLAAEAVPLALGVLALAFGAWEAWRRLQPEHRDFWLLQALWPVSLVAFFTLAGVQVVSRYLLIATPCVLALGLAGFRHLTHDVGARRRAGVLLVGALFLHAAANVGVTFLVSVPAARAHATGLRASLGSIGIWARKTTPPGTLFAVADIGAFGYYSDRRVLDLYGLVTPALAPLTVRDGYDRVVRDLAFESVERPLYLIDRARVEGRLATGEPESPYRFLFSRRIPNLGITRPGEWVYSVYRIDWGLWDQHHPRLAGR